MRALAFAVQQSCQRCFATAGPVAINLPPRRSSVGGAQVGVVVDSGAGSSGDVGRLPVAASAAAACIILLA